MVEVGRNLKDHHWDLLNLWSQHISFLKTKYLNILGYFSSEKGEEYKEKHMLGSKIKNKDKLFLNGWNKQTNEQELVIHLRNTEGIV